MFCDLGGWCRYLWFDVYEFAILGQILAVWLFCLFLVWFDLCVVAFSFL